MTTAVFVEPRLLKDSSIADGLKTTKFPIYEVRGLEDITQATKEDDSLRDKYILVILSDFEGDLFKLLKRRLKVRKPKVTIIGPPYFHELLIQGKGCISLRLTAIMALQNK